MNILFKKSNIKSFTSLIGIFIRKGKKNKALSCFFYILKRINQLKQNKQSALVFLYKSLNNIYPELSFRRLGRRKIFYLPKVITNQKKVKICMNWIKKSAGGHKSQLNFKEKIANELIEAYYKKGEIIKKKKNMYRLLLEGRAFLYILKHWRLTNLELNHIVRKYKKDQKKRKNIQKIRNKKNKIII